MLKLDIVQPSRISTIFYLGMEGLGGIDMDTDEEDNVRNQSLQSQSPR